MIHLISPEPLIPLENTVQSDLNSLSLWLSGRRVVGLDIETTGLDPEQDRIVTVCVGNATDQWVIDARHTDIEHLHDMLYGRTCVGHGIKFDLRFLRHYGVDLRHVWDTLICEKILFNGFFNYGFGLDDLSKRYLNVDLSKQDRKSFIHFGSKPLSAKQILYAAEDVRVLLGIQSVQKHRLAQAALTRAFELEMGILPFVADMEANGVAVDTDLWKQRSLTRMQQMAQLEIEMDAMLIADFNMPSNEQKDIFTPEVRLLPQINYNSPPKVKRLLGLYGVHLESTDDKHLQAVRNPPPFLVKLQEHRELSKEISTYGAAFLDNIKPVTGRIHTNFDPMKETYRFSSSEPNMQNIPKSNDYRHRFIAQPGWMIVSNDFSQQELRIMGALSQEPMITDAVHAGIDVHCHIASEVFGRKITKQDKAERDVMKTINFGKPYGMNEYSLSDRMGIPLQQAKEIFALYARKLPKLESWLSLQAETAVRQGYVSLPVHGGRRYFPELAKIASLGNDKDGVAQTRSILGRVRRKGMNFPIQGLGAVMLKHSILEVGRLLETYNKNEGDIVARFWLQVHDELNLEVRQEHAEQVNHLVRQAMIRVGAIYIPDLPMDVDSTITSYWTKG